MAEKKKEPKKEATKETKKDAGIRKLIPIFIMGKEYMVPETATILKAFEYAGYRFTRGCGCRGGVCGACATVYRKKGDYRIKVALACQTVVEEGMYLTQIPFYPATKAEYNIEDLKATAHTLLSLYPELARCVSCNTCGKICPQDIKVMDYVNAALRGDIKRAAELSFECIMCGLCASRCPAEIVQYHIATLCRRLYARHIALKSKELAERVAQIERGECDADLAKIKSKTREELITLYAGRDIEPT